MAFEELQALEDIRADASAVERAMLASAVEDRKAEAAEAREKADRDAAREQRAEALAFAESQTGSLAELARHRQAYADAADECADLAARLAKAEARRDRAQGNVEFFASRAQESAELVQRSVEPSSDPVEQASRAAHKVFVEATRAKMAAAAAGRAPGKARRPFAAGYAVRSEATVTCPECLKLDVTPEQSFLIHHTDADGNVTAAEPEQQRQEHGGRTPMIYR